MKKYSVWLRRMLNARKIGVPFFRAAAFKIPLQISLSGKKKPLSLPLDLGTKNAFIDIFLDDCYGLTGNRFKNIKTIIDIGGHAGLFSAAARVRFPESIIQTYEPNPEMLRYLSDQAETFNFTYYPEAVGSESGKVSLTSEKDNVFTQTRRSPEGAITQISFAECLSRIGGSVDLLKLDCEGAEWDILKCAKIFRNVRNIVMEYHLMGDHSKMDICKTITELNFKIIKYKAITESCGIVWAIQN